MKRPSFNVPGTKTGRFCSEHKEEGMVNVRLKICEHHGCMKWPVFIFPGSRDSKPGRFCSRRRAW